ncbi:unnamed protein product [Victoria cruziana]
MFKWGRWASEKRHHQGQLLPTVGFSSWTGWGRGGAQLVASMKKPSDKSEWWVIDGEMHEIGDNVPPRERFAIPRDNIPSRRRKQMREQFMRRTRLVLKETEHEPWCKRYIELYEEIRENWERLYWDEGYSKKLAQDHANYESEEDDVDFSPNRFVSNEPGDTWKRAEVIRDKFEYDRERRMREKAFAPMGRGGSKRGLGFNNTSPRSLPFDVNNLFPENTRE